MDYNKFIISNIPWFHGSSSQFLNQDKALLMAKKFPSINDEVWQNYGKTFDTKYGIKKELTNKSYMHESIREFMNLLESNNFIRYVEEITGVKNLFVDKNLYGGGLNLYPGGSHLHPHVDFNFNDEIHAYRTVNLIYYLNDNYQEDSGGEFCLYSSPKKIEKLIKPILNTCILFVTNKKTIHGVKRTNKNFYRKSISVWYYTRGKEKDQDSKPHQTIWK